MAKEKGPRRVGDNKRPPPMAFGMLPKSPEAPKKRPGTLGMVKGPNASVSPKTHGSRKLPPPVPFNPVTIKPGVTSQGGVAGQIQARVKPLVVGKHEMIKSRFTGILSRGRNYLFKFWKTRDLFQIAKAQNRVAIRWVGPIFDESGYGEACRNYICALSTTGMPITSSQTTFGEPATEYGQPGRICMSTLNLGHPWAINLVYSPPHFFDKHRDSSAYNIGMFAWEMDWLPAEWVGACNRMNEIWVPCQWNARAVRQSGVKVPIHVFGHSLNPREYEGVRPLPLQGIDPSWYKFYSIFQWSERKNPETLLKSYLCAFTAADPVVLILKTYGANYGYGEEKKVKESIDKIRAQVGGSQPKVLLITKMLSKTQILGLHKFGDCFFLPHRAEGWGLPHFEACMSGKPVITTKYGGNLEFTKPENSYLVDYNPINVTGMEWFRWFTPDMTWADAHLDDCVDKLRYVFDNREEARAKGAAAKEYVSKTFNWNMVGAAMKARLDKILTGL